MTNIIISVVSLLQHAQLRVPLLTFTLLALVVAVRPQYNLGMANKMPWGHKCVLENVEPTRILPSNAEYLCPKHTHTMIIRKSKLRRFPAIFSVYPDLQTLDVTSNDIINIESTAFDDAHSLKVLKLSGNNITSLQNYVFNGASFVVRLDLRRCGINEINKHSFLGLSQLTILDLSENRIQTLPSGVFDHIVKLTVLNLGSNQIENIDNRILIRQMMLKSLILSRNRLENIHENALMTSELVTLDLDHNPTLKILKLAVSYMVHMETLKVNNCSLETLFVPPTAITVEASKNNIKNIVAASTPKNQNFMLRRLNLDHNRLANFLNLTAFNKLEMLDINDNLITTLNVTQLKFMDKLTLVQVARNPLKDSIDVDGIAKALPVLEELIISKSKFNDAYLSEVRRNFSTHNIQLLIDEDVVSPRIINPFSTFEDEINFPTISMPRNAADLRKSMNTMRDNYYIDRLNQLELETDTERVTDEWMFMAARRDRTQKTIATFVIWMYALVIMGAIDIVCRIYLKRSAIRDWFNRVRIAQQAPPVVEIEVVHLDPQRRGSADRSRSPRRSRRPPRSRSRERTSSRLSVFASDPESEEEKL